MNAKSICTGQARYSQQFVFDNSGTIQAAETPTKSLSNNLPFDFFLQDLQHSLSSIYVLGINRQVQNPIPHPRKERGWFILTSEN